MKTELINVSQTQKEIKIQIDADVIKESFNRVSKKYAKKANVPGFRKGFAPLDVVRLRYKEEIRNDVLQEIVPEVVTNAIREHELQPLVEPKMHLDNAAEVKLNGTEPVSLHVHVEVMPEIPTPDYKGLEATRRVRPLNDGEVDGLIDERRQKFASLIPVENRKSKDGDTVIVDLEGTFVDEPDSEPIKADDLEITLGDEVIEKSFTENLVGVEEDEVKEFEVSYPAEFSSPALAGKTVRYKAKIKSLGKVELPELDDEWARSLDEGYKSLKDLREKLTEDLEKVAGADADARVRNDLIAKMIEKNDFEVPNALIDIQARNLLDNFAQDLAQRGVDLNKVEKDFVQMAYSQMRGQAERDVRGAMLLEKISEIENIEIKEEEVAEEIERIANYYGVTADDVRGSLARQGGEAGIANNLRTRKAIEAIVENAKITEGEWIDETQPVGAPEESEEKPAKKSAKAKAEKPKAEGKAKAKPSAKKKKAGDEE